MFGLGALVLSVAMGSLAYFTARHYLLSDQENAAKKVAFQSARYVQGALPGNADITGLLESLDAGAGVASHSVLYHNGGWYSSVTSVSQQALSPALKGLVRSGTPATQNFTLNGAPQIAVGVPIPSVKADYFEIFNVSDLAHTLRVLALTLFGAGLITTALGYALGRSASGRSLRPLNSVSRAAMAIAGGNLRTRLPAASDDPDLAGLTLSFNRMVDQLQERIERETRFTSDVSHELRSPLTTLSASVEVLESHRDELSTRDRRALDLLAADLRRFQRMVDELLEISRSDTGSAELWLEDVDADELVRRAVAVSVANLRRPEEAQADGVPTIDVDAVAGVRLRVDKRRFERIMANLLENAYNYGGGATRVTAEPGPVRHGQPTVRVSVEDHGPGLAPGERAKVFERFYRGQAAGRRGTGTGTGLGLALVAEHVRLNGGKVWAEAGDEGGARFVVELPVTTDSEGPRLDEWEPV